MRHLLLSVDFAGDNVVPGMNTQKTAGHLVTPHRLQTSISPYSHFSTLILIPIVFLLGFCPSGAKAADGGYSGTILDSLAATYVVRLDDGRLLDAEWNSGYDDWSSGDRVILTTDSGEGYMYDEDRRTQVDIFTYNPADIGD